ncbi:hypothetical protein [Mycolicibacterium insubricum]|uniref:hypothetical protein n=1 Tax=Mycolicibacterium insubricum TaxID=444597 RepID=UPI0013D75A31|nr:hypothetical protein [Mycolicibacterium insubricum]
MWIRPDNSRQPDEDAAGPRLRRGDSSVNCQVWHELVLNCLSVASMVTICAFLVSALSRICAPSSPPMRFQ